MLHIITVPQVDGVRYLALTAADAAAVRRDRTMLDAVTALAALDADGEGYYAWAHPFGCDNTPAGRDAIRAHLRAACGVTLR